MSKKKILIVDDEENFRGVLRKLVTELDCEALEAADGAETKGIIESQKPALVLMDIHMPKLDGIAVLSEIRDTHPDLPVIVVTGDASEARAKLSMERGASDFFAKPVDMECLRTSITANLLRNP